MGKVFKYPRGASPTVDAALDHFGEKMTRPMVDKVAKMHGMSGDELLKGVGKGPKWSTHKIFNVLGYEVAAVGMPRSSWNKAMDSATDIYRSPAIKKARVKPLRRSI